MTSFMVDETEKKTVMLLLTNKEEINGARKKQGTDRETHGKGQR